MRLDYITFENIKVLLANIRNLLDKKADKTESEEIMDKLDNLENILTELAESSSWQTQE